MYFEDLKIGDAVHTDGVPICRADMVAFAEKYDPLPLHTDEDFAKTTRFGTLIAPGVMAFMSVWAAYLRKGDFCGEQVIAGKSTRVEWFLPVFDGDVLTGDVRITGLTPRNAYNGAVEITVDIRNQKGELVMCDVTEAIVARRGAEEP